KALMSQVPMAMLDVGEIETGLLRQARGLMSSLNDGSKLPIAQQRIIAIHAHAAIQERVMIKNPRFELGVQVGAAETARMSQLQAHQEALLRTSGGAV